MLDKDTMMIKSVRPGDTDDSDLQDCLHLAKSILKEDDEVKKNFLESVDRYLEIVRSDR